MGAVQEMAASARRASGLALAGRGPRCHAVNDPVLRHEGNRRLAACSLERWPLDLEAARRELDGLLAEGEIANAGSLGIVVDLPPDDPDPGTWRCQICRPVIGLHRPRPPLLIEDYRGLDALVLPHLGPVRDLASTWRRLADHARAAGWRPRPYWRVEFVVRRSSDGMLLPRAEVSVFVDR